MTVSTCAYVTVGRTLGPDPTPASSGDRSVTSTATTRPDALLAELAQQLRAALGEDAVITDPADLPSADESTSNQAGGVRITRACAARS